MKPITTIVPKFSNVLSHANTPAIENTAIVPNNAFKITKISLLVIKKCKRHIHSPAVSFTLSRNSIADIIAAIRQKSFLK